MSVSLEQTLGFRIKVTNVLDVVTEGRLYSFNSSNNTLTIQTTKKNQAPQNFKVIKCTFIKHLEVIGDKPSFNSFKKQQIKPSYVNVERVEKLLKESVIASKKKELLRGKGVSAEGQFIFDQIFKTIGDTKWVAKDIIILDDVKVQPPYKVEDIKVLHEGSNQSITLIQRIVERSWEQLEQDDGRKGG